MELKKRKFLRPLGISKAQRSKVNLVCLKSMTQGYLLIANGEEYAKMLQTYVIPTIRYWDTKRPITILTTNPECFDPVLYSTILYDPLLMREKYLHLRPSKYFLLGTMPKLLIFDLSPYDETMYLDADILCMKDINDLWTRCVATGKQLVVCGTSDESNRAPATWHWDTINEVIEKLGFNVPRINGGFQYWRKTDDFITIVDPYLLNPSKYKIKPWFRDGYVDEIFISIYIDQPCRSQSIQVTTMKITGLLKKSMVTLKMVKMSTTSTEKSCVSSVPILSFDFLG